MTSVNEVCVISWFERWLSCLALEADLKTCSKAPQPTGTRPTQQYRCGELGRTTQSRGGCHSYS
eukprot:1676577-Amphidinium_carterae.1